MGSRGPRSPPVTATIRGNDEGLAEMRYSSEMEIKRELGIDTWRELSKDKLLRFAAMMPDMDTEVALKVVEQFPSFKEFAVDVVKAMETAHESTLTANARSGNEVHEAFKDIRAVLKTELDKDDLLWEQRRWIIEQIQETGRQQFDKDSENKRFLDSTLGKVVVGAGGVVALGLAALGGRVLEQRGPDSRA